MGFGSMAMRPSGFSWETANRKSHVTAALRYVCSLQFTFKPQEGLPAVIDLRQSFLPQKIVQPRVYRCELAFYTRLQCVCWIFDLESMNYC